MVGIGKFCATYTRLATHAGLKEDTHITSPAGAGSDDFSIVGGGIIEKRGRKLSWKCMRNVDELKQAAGVRVLRKGKP
jgi:hypothetical protein